MSQLTLADARTIIAAAEKTADDILAVRRKKFDPGRRGERVPDLLTRPPTSGTSPWPNRVGKNMES